MGTLLCLSAVVELVDGFLDRPARVAAPRFEWDGKPCMPIAKPQARYVFFDVRPGAHVLRVVVPPFDACEMELVLPEAACASERLIRCVLKPGPHYAYPACATLIHGRVCGTAGDATISADYRSVHGRPHTVQAPAGNDRDYVLVLQGKLADPTAVSLRVDVPGGVAAQQQISVTPGRATRVDVLPK
ncbi:hypothetical protein EO087_14295 [Dyella sp. M7H15-1]|uniref:hypothetical protein n=1 Tax=Dyella sp. M7H15-1 TaxID=2501295 RepID=UPI001004F214|nr:hypothetical protein [Dyella sp. M7H15-1]QAU25020.1 hypothetical protein EO087_14295 [Dyella sp. M7H15-1]